MVNSIISLANCQTIWMVARTYPSSVSAFVFGRYVRSQAHDTLVSGPVSVNDERPAAGTR